MWLKTLCLLCVFSYSVYGLTPFGKMPRPPSKPVLVWSTDKSYTYSFNAKINENAKERDLAMGQLKLQWKRNDALVGNVVITWVKEGVDNEKTEPFIATFRRGLLNDLRVSPDADKWSIELIRAILSQIQTSDLVYEQEDFSIMEESVTGKCETHYKLLTTNKIQKTKDYMKCEKVPVYERGVFGKDNWEAIMKKQDIIQRTSNTEMNFDQGNFPREIKTIEQIEIKSENSVVLFQTIMSISFESFGDGVTVEDDFIPVGGLMYQAKPQKRFCNKNGGLNRNEIESSCEADYYMNPKHFSTLNDDDTKITKAQEIIEKIAQDLKNPSEMPKTNTLDRFTVLVGLVRRMNVDELEQVSNLWEFENRETFVYQSALTAAGTLDSLLMIKSLKKNGGLKTDLEITGMPSTVHPLTLEYLDTFFDFATDPEIMNSDFDFSKDLILDFTNLLRRYTTEKEKPFEMEQLNRLILKKYRKYFSRQLQENLMNENKLKFQVYVRAVGNMADLSLFNYLLSLKPGKLSPFQKTLVVNSMDKTLELYPAKSRAMLTKLYENEDEGVSVRIAAMYQLFKTDLPKDMVLDVIRIANDSGNKDIKNAVKTTVMSHAYSYHLDEEISGLAEELIPDETPETTKKERLSLHRFQDRSDNITKTHDIYEFIKSYDENPLSMFFKRITDRKGFKTDFKMSGMFNNIDDFIQALNRPSSSIYPMRGYYERLRSKLSSANFEVDTDFNQFFVPLENISPNSLSILKFFERDQQLNYAVLSMDEVEIGFPTEIGLPFVYSHQSPEYVSYDISTNVEDTFTMNIHLIWSLRKQTKMGIMNPISGKYYVTGVDMNQQINIPITISYQKFLGAYFIVSIDPLIKEGIQRILHLGTWPYVGELDIFPLVPTAEDDNIKITNKENVITAKQYLDDSDRFLVQATSSKINSTENIMDYFSSGELEAYEYFGPFGEVSPKHNLFNIFFKEDEETNTSLIFTLDLTGDQLTINTVDEPYGKIQGPFFFMGKILFQTSLSLTGPTNRSVTVTANQAVDAITQALKISLKGSYSENETVTFQGCSDTVISDQRKSMIANKADNVIIHIRMKGGKSCEEGGMISLETEMEPEKLQGSKIEAEFTVDFKDIPDDIAVEICKMSDEDYSQVDNIKIKFVQKNEEQCKELIRNENNESIENVEGTTIENFDNIEGTTQNIDAVEVMWDEASI